MNEMLSWLFGDNCYVSNSLLLFGVIFLAVIYSWYNKSSNLPPGPWGIPLLGIMPFLGKYPERTLRKYSETYGPIISVRMATMDTVVLNDYDSIYQALAKQASKFSGRPSFSWLDDILKKPGIITLDHGTFFKSQRKFGLTTLRGFGMGKKSMEERVIEEAVYFNERIRSQNGKAFDISDNLRIAVANNICSVIFGTRFSYDDKSLTELMDLLLISHGKIMNILETIAE
ncbi:cytochrome P450 2H2-like isoform X2 [Clavelina lepadiformis]|uniref:cytochrome P450 2H2-like isoform X2 n=1 Tax=Clavelina lepadiformis TaxID=159417 RepID=UPI00404205CD